MCLKNVLIIVSINLFLTLVYVCQDIIYQGRLDNVKRSKNVLQIRNLYMDNASAMKDMCSIEIELLVLVAMQQNSRSLQECNVFVEKDTQEIAMENVLLL